MYGHHITIEWLNYGFDHIQDGRFVIHHQKFQGHGLSGRTIRIAVPSCKTTRTGTFICVAAYFGPGNASNTSRTLRARLSGVKGFCMKAFPASSPPTQIAAAPVYPDMKSTFASGCAISRHCARVLPLIPGITKSVSKRWMVIFPSALMVTSGSTEASIRLRAYSEACFWAVTSRAVAH